MINRLNFRPLFLLLIFSYCVPFLAISQEGAENYYVSEISSQIVQVRCVACHVDGGVADGLSRLIFERDSTSNYQSLNHSAFSNFLGLSDVTSEFALAKASGGEGHVGGAQVAAGTSEYTVLETYFGLISEPSDTPDDTGSDEDPDTTSDPDSESSTSPEEYYTDNISSEIVQGRCVACHVSGGAAEGLARLIFVRSTDENYLTTNQQAFVDFLALEDADTTLILSKASGGDGHVGGTQTPVGSDNYNSLEIYLNLLTGTASGSSDEGSFWDGVTLLSPELTLRKASIILTGGLPAESLSNWVGEDEARLRRAILSIMDGDGFHDFLIRGANDKLLTLKFEDFSDYFSAGAQRFPNYDNHWLDLFVEGDYELAGPFQDKVSKATARAPLELVAHVIENELPYTEILTAEYTMVNPTTNFIFESGVEFEDENDFFEFKPGTINDLMYQGDCIVTEEAIPLIHPWIIEECDKVDYPHAGILNDPMWLNRYPSTATNRNRARSRWTYYYFLDFDIEKSAGRTQDPEALADTNNPTLNNPNCTVCHQTLDPVAGAYQNYGDEGWYRDKWGGLDSLPDTYKWDEDTPYMEGDTWYRTMLAPGFEGVEAPSNDNSIQWLAEQIVKDERFGTASVKFWWPAILSSNPMDIPNENSSSAYETAFAEQSGFISGLATDLASHWNIKETMADIIMSPWFRAFEADTDAIGRLAETSAGNRHLLTPEQLDIKTKSLSGQSWGEYYDDRNARVSNLISHYSYAITYGGIDSDGITKRAREMTSVMSQVALTHSAEMACGIVLEDFQRNSDERLLFNEIEPSNLPGEIDSQQFSVAGSWPQNASNYRLTTSLEAGEQIVSISYLNDIWVEETQLNRDLLLNRIQIYDSNNNIVFESEASDLEELGGSATCGGLSWNEVEDFTQESDWNLWSNCTYRLPVTLDDSGDYLISVNAYYLEWDKDGDVRDPEQGAGPASMSVSVSVANPLTQNSPGAELIKSQLVSLHNKLLGEDVTSSDTQIAEAFELFYLSQVNALNSEGSGHIQRDNTHCDFDYGQYDDPESGANGWDVGNDSNGTLSAWRAIIAYYLSHPNYVHE